MNSGTKLILLATIMIAISFGCRPVKVAIVTPTPVSVEESPTPVDNQEEIGIVQHTYSSPPAVAIDKDKKYYKTNF